MTGRHSTLFTLESGQSGPGFYTTQRDAALENMLRILVRLIQHEKSGPRALQ
jgi:hypothetical protein